MTHENQIFCLKVSISVDIKRMGTSDESISSRNLKKKLKIFRNIYIISLKKVIVLVHKAQFYRELCAKFKKYIY